MISHVEIMEAIHQLALKQIPELKLIETDVVPKNANRPAWLTEYITTTRRDAAATLVEVTQHFTVTIFVNVEEHGNSVTHDLLTLQEKAMNLFLCGYLRVADRALNIKASSAGRGRDEAYVDVQLEYMDSRHIPEQLPMMEKLYIKYTN